MIPLFGIRLFLVITLYGSTHSYCQLTDTLAFPVQHKGNQFLRKFAIPTVMIGLGIYGTTDNNIINHDEIREERFEYFPGFTNKADNYLQFAAIPAVFVMDAFHIKATHVIKEQLWLLGKSQLIMFSLVYPLKQWTHVLRPDSSANNSFPSGHTAQAFLAATFFYKEYGKKYPVLGIGMFTVATGIGILRILNNKHWISDVLAGAGIGILSVELASLLPSLKQLNKHKISASLVPSYRSGHFNMTALVNLP